MTDDEQEETNDDVSSATSSDSDHERGKKRKPLPPPFAYADFEAMQTPQGMFVPNLLCSVRADDDECQFLWGESCPLDFLEALDAMTESSDDDREQPVIVLRLRWNVPFTRIVSTATGGHPSVNSGGNSGPLKFIDSLSFLPMALAAFSSTFGITELKKGFFPYLFNTPDRQDYYGEWPALSFYDPEGMMNKKKKELETWHAEQVACDQPFDFRKELRDYCESDVLLLKAGCQAFQKQLENQANFNPMGKSVTIASACNLYWRMHHLPQDLIAVEPLRGWRGAQVNQSLKALQWLYYQESLIPKQGACAFRIKHVRNGGEQSVLTATDSHFVDGFDPQRRTVYELHGCLCHGCKKYYPHPRDTLKHNATPDRTLEEKYLAPTAKTTELLLAGYLVKEIWECEWDIMVRDDPSVRAFLNGFDLVAPLNRVTPFFGERTGAVALHAVADPSKGEEIRYVDVTSLYPWVNKTCEYPVGHPKITTHPGHLNIEQYFGVALVDILPTSGLFHPVLPVRSGNKLTFPLCQACITEEQSIPLMQRSSACIHNNTERTLRGTCTPEIQESIRQGYQLQNIHEVWHFPPHQRKTGLFKDHVNMWLKIKQESAGWPRWYNTEEQKQQYISDYHAQEEITLDYAKVAKNPGRKATAKLMLNSFWGTTK